MASFWRLVLFVATVGVVFGGTVVAIFYARGYRVDLGNRSIGKTGLLVATSTPDGAQVWVNGELRSATNATVALAPGEYTVELKKEGLSTWKKKITLKAEEVVKTEAVLFPTLPNLRPMSFSGVVNPRLSPLGDRLVYATPLGGQGLATASPKSMLPNSTLAATGTAAGIPSGSPTTGPVAGSPRFVSGEAGSSGIASQTLENQLATRAGLWVLDLIDMPLGFSREPRQIVRSTVLLDWGKAVVFWSPDERQVLAVFMNKPSGSASLSQTKTNSDTVKSIKLSEVRSAYLLDSSKLNNPGELIDITSDLVALSIRWESERKQMGLSQLSKLPAPLKEVLAKAAAEIKFSPDETKMLYQATVSATIPNNILPLLPGSNSQPQQRSLHSGGIYVYDLKEDRNFWIKDLPVVLSAPKGTVKLDGNELFDAPTAISWFPTSRHLLWINGEKITILEYDGTNPVDVYTGPFADKDAFPSSNGARLVILTDLGSGTETANLYSLILK